MTDPDAYLCYVADELPNEVVVTVIRLAGEKRRPLKTAPNLLAHLAAASVPARVQARPLLEPNVP